MVAPITSTSSSYIFSYIFTASLLVYLSTVFKLTSAHVWITDGDRFGFMCPAPFWCTGFGDGVAGGRAAGLQCLVVHKQSVHGDEGSLISTGRLCSDCKSRSKQHLPPAPLDRK